MTAVIPTWGLMAIGAILFLAVVVVLAVALRKRPIPVGGEPGLGMAWGDPHGDLPPVDEPAWSPQPQPAAAAPAAPAAPAMAHPPEFEPSGPPPAPAGPTHHCRCPSCKTQFTVDGPKPIVTNCPGCGRKGFLR